MIAPVRQSEGPVVRRSPRPDASAWMPRATVQSKYVRTLLLFLLLVPVWAAVPNESPTLAPISDLTIVEDSGVQGVAPRDTARVGITFGIGSDRTVVGIDRSQRRTSGPAQAAAAVAE